MNARSDTERAAAASSRGCWREAAPAASVGVVSVA